ncbi:MAG: DegQ family serine endoprotease [Candidatus Sericytochromatia bacterium]|nr:DegQ family serine endoprotease [Candidatus Sericytochromatia bacterium]
MRKVTFGAALATAAVAGTVVGLVISSRLDLVPPGYTSDDRPLIGGKMLAPADFVAVARRVTPAVISITSSKLVRPGNPGLESQGNPFDFFKLPNARGQARRATSLGSGVIVSADGLAVTNNHVVEEADQIEAVLPDKRRYKAVIVGTDPKTDMAVIRLTGAKNLPVVPWGDSRAVQVGEWVLAIGNPMGLSSTVTAGIISAEGRADVGVAEFEDFLQTDAAINPGNSGGALVTMRGELIGINTAIASRSGGSVGIGFAIPSRMARAVMEALVTKGKVTRGYLGIGLEPMSEELAKHFHWSDTSKGILVAEVQPGTPAAVSGLKDGDIIVGLNGEVVREVNQFRNAIALTRPGTKVQLDIVRQGKPQSMAATLAELPASRERPDVEPQSAPGTELGFEVQNMSADLARKLELPPTAAGAVVTDVAADSAAETAGLEAGDLIVAINKRPVRSAGDFTKVANRLKAGDSVLLRVQRGDAGRYLAFRLE